MTVKMIAPSGFSGTVSVTRSTPPSSGSTYVPDAGGFISADSRDVTQLLSIGFTFAQTSGQSEATNGLFPTSLALTHFKNADGSTLAAAASSGKFGQTVTLGTTQHLISESANNGTKTDDAIAEYVLPPWYVAGKNITVTVNASITGAGTLTTKSAQIKAFRNANDGTQGSDIGPGAATAMTAAGADVPFTITGTTLNPGDKITLELETVLVETASSGMVANINSVRIS